MRISPGIGHEPSLQRLVIASVVLHFILMALFFIPFRTGEKEYKTYYVSLAEPAKVIGGGEPAVRKSEEKAPVKKEASAKEKKTAEDKEIAAKKEQMALKAVEKRRAEEEVAKEIERLKRIKDISKGKEDRDKNREKIEVVKKEINDASAKGVGGAQSRSEEMVSDPYYGEITAIIQDEWSTYPTFESEGLEVEILIKIDSKGKVVPKIEKSSGNKIFDEAAIKTIIRASPLPSPPPWVDKEIIVRLKG